MASAQSWAGIHKRAVSSARWKDPAFWPGAGTKLRCAVPAHHCRAKLGELFWIPWRAGVMRGQSSVFRREAERNGHSKFIQRFHLLIEPRQRVRTEAVSPGQAGAQIRDIE